MTPNFNTHTPSTLSTIRWEGSDSAKFKGGRLHSNHPRDQLNSLLTGSKSTELQLQGKRQFSNSLRGQDRQSVKPQLKTFDSKYKKSTVFDEQNLAKLIKVPFISDSDSKMVKVGNKDKYNYSTLGRSKIKQLQKGAKQTGIYRQFYNSQAKSMNVFCAHQ